MKMYRKIEQAVILAGGLGTRLKPFTDNAPKPMFPINETPFIEYLLKQIKHFGINDVLILLGYMPEVIIDYLGNGENLGISISYSVTPINYETGLRLKIAESELKDEFLLMYCDNYCPIDFEGLCGDYYENNALIQMTAYTNLDGYTKSNLLVRENGLVELYDRGRRLTNLQGVDIGYAIVNKCVLQYLKYNNVNFEETIYPLLIEQKKVYATCTEHRYYSIGLYERIENTKKFFSKRKVVFLDRDGTLNKKPLKAHYIESPEDFVWLPKAREAIKILKDNDFFIILITNQPGMARGSLTEATLKKIHKKMETDLKRVGAGIDKIYYCPHNWSEGCSCRKPKPGMLYQAQKEFSLNLSECIMIGDDIRDIIAGEAAGCRTYLIDEKNSLYDIVQRLV